MSERRKNGRKKVVDNKDPKKEAKKGSGPNQSDKPEKIGKNAGGFNDSAIGTRIRKHFPSKGWRIGTIICVKAGDQEHDMCTIEYEEGLPKTEELPVDDVLHRWVVAHQWFSLAKESDKPVKKKELFRRTQAASQPYTLDQFLSLWKYAEGYHGGVTLERLEASKLVQSSGNARPTEVYGRMLPGAIDKIYREHMDLRPEHFVVDIGHGIGNSCLQAAYTIGCKNKGIECDESRNAIAEILAISMNDAAQIHKDRDNMTFTPGSMVFRNGNLEELQHKAFITDEITHIFFDNWNGVFSGERGDAPNLERYIAALFAASGEGTIMTTTSPLRSAMGPLPLKEANKMRKARGLPETENASYYELEEHDLAPLGKVYNFASESDVMIKLYKYTRTSQSTNGVASFACNISGCQKARDATPIEAIRHEKNKDGSIAEVIGACDCGVTERVLRKRKKRTP